jgi:hypothetical protein
MPLFHIRVINSEFHSTNEADASDIEEARRQGLSGALQIAVDEVCGGTPFFGADVRIELNGEVKERMMVAVGASPLRRADSAA